MRSLEVRETDPFGDDPRRLGHVLTLVKAKGGHVDHDVAPEGVALLKLVIATEQVIQAHSWPDGYATPAVGEILHGIGQLCSMPCGQVIPGVVERWRQRAAGMIGWDLDLGEPVGLRDTKP